jgi:MerR family transcriptional regulator, light-induced transcriptional regulator
LFTVELVQATDLKKIAVSFLAAGEAARRLGVSPITIQRWADQGLITAERTLGGHRRIPVSEVERLLAPSHPDRSSQVTVWVDALMSWNSNRVLTSLEEARQGTDSWAKVADDVATALKEIGRSWDVGDCSVFEEHLASEALRRATIRCVAAMRQQENAPRAVLMTVEDERHTLGLSLSELVFVENGWSTVWIGEGPPSSELGEMIEALKPEVVAVSASESRAPSSLKQYQKVLTQLAPDHQFQLLFAGGGRWADAANAHRASSFVELDHWLKEHKSI